MAKCILIVDDEEDLVKAMRVRLASWGYDVLSASTGKEAIGFVATKIPDAVILDIVMPEMGGIETLRRIRRFNPEIPIIMLTAYGDEEKFEKSEKLGIAGFVHKCADFDNASEFIKIVLEGQGLK